MLLSTQLVRMIEEHSDELTRAAVADLQTNPKTPSYHALSRAAIHQRVFEVHPNLGQWLMSHFNDRIESLHQLLPASAAKKSCRWWKSPLPAS